MKLKNTIFEDVKHIFKDLSVYSLFKAENPDAEVPYPPAAGTIREAANCAFQYGKIHNSGSINIVCDKSELTLEDAKKLWNEHFSDAAKWIKNGKTVEMVIWIDMETPESFGKWLEFVSTDAESDGIRIWENKKTYFTNCFEL